MKLWLSFFVLVAVSSFSQAVPLKDVAIDDNEVNEEMMRGMVKSFTDSDISFNSYSRISIDGLFKQAQLTGKLICVRCACHC